MTAATVQADQDRRSQSSVLIVDDEPDMRQLLLEVFETAGIDAAASGPLDAVSTLESLAPKVLVLDVSMPEVDGYDILRHVRADRRSGSPFVLMLTGRTRIEDLQACFDNGADDFLTKPFAVEELVARVRRAL